MTDAARKLPELFITEERGAGQALAAIGTVSYRHCVNVSARTGYPEKIAIGSRSISRSRPPMSGDGPAAHGGGSAGCGGVSTGPRC
jgi:hypothetical protein